MLFEPIDSEANLSDLAERESLENTKLSAKGKAKDKTRSLYMSLPRASRFFVLSKSVTEIRDRKKPRP